MSTRQLHSNTLPQALHCAFPRPSWRLLFPSCFLSIRLDASEGAKYGPGGPDRGEEDPPRSGEDGTKECREPTRSARRPLGRWGSGVGLGVWG